MIQIDLYGNKVPKESVDFECGCKYQRFNDTVPRGWTRINCDGTNCYFESEAEQ